jgi:hypothetical protein
LSQKFLKVYIIPYHLTSVYIIFDERPNSLFFVKVIVEFMPSCVCQLAVPFIPYGFFLVVECDAETVFCAFKAAKLISWFSELGDDVCF